MGKGGKGLRLLLLSNLLLPILLNEASASEPLFFDNTPAGRKRFREYERNLKAIINLVSPPNQSKTGSKSAPNHSEIDSNVAPT